VRRRTFLASSAAGAAGAAAWLAGCGPRARAAAPDVAPDAAPGAGPLVFVGTYTEKTNSRGVYRYRADARSGAWTPLGAADVGPNPSFLAVHPNGRVLYVVNEVEQFAGGASGAVRAFAIDRATGALAPLGAPVATGGGAPCYVAVDATGRLLMVANYLGGSVAAFPLAADGTPGARSFLDQHAGRGPRADRQEAAHAHCVIPDPSNRWAVSADLGLDRVTVHALDAGAGTLAPARAVAVRAGAGPRHLAFHPAGRALYVVGELDLTLTTFAFDPATGALTAPEVVPLLAGPAAPGSTAADLHLHPSGRALYVSVRGDDSLARFALDPAAGRPTFAERVPTRGRRPRNFALDPAGRFLYAANQGSNAVAGFAVDPRDGRLAPAALGADVPAPVCIRFA
jgi:6-phosphogluconolactonase